MTTFLAGSTGIGSKVKEKVDKLDVVMLGSIEKSRVALTIFGIDLFGSHLSIEGLEGHEVVLSRQHQQFIDIESGLGL